MNMMNNLKTHLLLALFAGLSFGSCTMDEGEEAEVSEFGAEHKEYVFDWKGGSRGITVLSNQTFQAELLDADNGWLRLDNENNTYFGDNTIPVTADANSGFPRMQRLRIWTHDRSDTLLVKQKGYTDPELNLVTRNISVLGDGGQAMAQIQTNIEIEEMNVEVLYGEEEAEEWISDLSITNGYLMMKTAPNTDREALRNARIRLTYTDGWEKTLTATVFVMQANALNEFGKKITFEELRDMVGRINRDVYIEGRIISDIGNGNNGENSMRTQTQIDYTETHRTVYIQSLDGKMGFMIKTPTVEDNIFERYSTVRLLLKGAILKEETEPKRYILERVTSTMVMSSLAGSAADVPVKEKYYSELTDDDLYTWVTLRDCELPVRKGSLTPINEGYSRATGANRISKYSMLVRDRKGDSFYMLTNTTCLYRRDGSMLPYGSGTISGVLVHETDDRFEWGGEPGMGEIGRYQIRHLEKSDIALKPDFKDSFSALLTEYRYGKLENHNFRPTTGDNGYLTHTCPDPVTHDAGYGMSDASYLGPVGNSDNPDGGENKGNINGNGVVEDGRQMCTSEDTNKDGKGNVSSADFSAWGNECNWWSTVTNRSEAWLLHLSTEGISTDMLSMQVAVHNRSVGLAPRYMRVDWSEHGDNSRDDWNYIGEFSVPDIVYWSKTQFWQSAGFKHVNVPLPLELLGRKDVCIRFSAASNKAGSKDEYDASPIGDKGSMAFSYIGIRYNK